MAQNITIAGAAFSAVPAIEVPKTGGGIATFADPSGTTATASDVAQGKLFLSAAGVLTTGTASGGGGASKLAQGTFTGEAAGSIIEVDLSYTGSGYPVAAIIYPADGSYNSSSEYYSLIQRYALNTWMMVKNYPLVSPTYQSSTTATQESSAYVRVTYKNSTSSSTSYTNGGTTALGVFTTANPSSSSVGSASVKFASSKKMKIYIANTQYGFAAGIEYAFAVVYSS